MTNNFFIGQEGLVVLPGWGDYLILVSDGKVIKKIGGKQEGVVSRQSAVGSRQSAVGSQKKPINYNL
jgi:hypothetical protein